MIDGADALRIILLLRDGMHCRVTLQRKDFADFVLGEWELSVSLK